MLTFLHLSDIHFRREVSATQFDIDADLRNELVRDLDDCCDFPATGILVTGDIAFAGKEAEYTVARNWLKELTSKLVCPEINVWTVPGNHDVDRDVVSQSDSIQRLHDELRSLRGGELEVRLRSVLRDTHEAKALFEPLQAYNDFALGFECDVDARDIYWQDDLQLNDYSVLRLRGLTSPMVSDLSDHIERARLFLSRYQTQLRREHGVEYLTLCHHPFDWLVDHESAREDLDRARIRLFGHKHRQRIRNENEGIFLVAGATHPDRYHEPEWQPRYNILQACVKQNEHGSRIMTLRVKARVWDDAGGYFKPDVDRTGSEIREFSYRLDDWARPVIVQESKPVSDSPTADETGGSDVSASKNVERPERMLTYRFISLPRQRQQRIALDLHLIEDTEWFREEAALWKTVFSRAREKRLLHSLWDAVESAIADHRFDGYSNPFIGELGSAHENTSNG